MTRARAAAAAAGFGFSCTDGVGRLLATLAAAAGTGPVGEAGTGYGVGTAWLRSGLADDARLVTVERDAARAASTAALFADDPAVVVLTDDWQALAVHGPYRLLFCDGGAKQGGPDAVYELVAPGGVVVLDDFTPSPGWPPTYRGRPDELRLSWLTDPRFVAVEVGTATDATAIVATRR
ncbi:MAG TPA: class I SAM-dependent methyltransferase [Actinocatenispora sp.]